MDAIQTVITGTAKLVIFALVLLLGIIVGCATWKERGKENDRCFMGVYCRNIGIECRVVFWEEMKCHTTTKKLKR